MKIGISTFYFAHNYGAMLQAFALKHHLESLGNEVAIDDYIPKVLRKEYTLNPFAKGKNPKGVFKRGIKIPKRLKQYRLFEQFKREELLNHNPLEVSAMFYGSDQIWNESITGKDTSYYGTHYGENVKKIAYAGSFGTSDLSAFQKECVKKYFKNFKAISLRETDLVNEIEKISGTSVISVVDPVFLVDKSQWISFSNEAKCSFKNYILYYALRNDPDLIRRTEQLAEKMNCEVVCIHPTCNDLNVGWKQLYNVGPYEFVNLVKNAELVSTNSFHAISFSIIFGKKAIYKSYSASESRVPSLLELCDAEICTDADKVYDFSLINRENLRREIAKSKIFIKEVLQD